jgi:hypothetical protein
MRVIGAADQAADGSFVEAGCGNDVAKGEAFAGHQAADVGGDGLC